MEPGMKRALKVGGSVLLALLVVVLGTLRVIGLDPADTGAYGRPGMWLQGELVTTPVTDWSFTDKIPHIAVETRTWYGIPHSITTNNFSHNGQLFITATYSQGGKGDDVVFPRDKFWTSNVASDPRVRLKIEGKLYEMSMIVVADRNEAETALESKWKKYPEMRPKRTEEHIHLFKLYQRNIPEYGGGLYRDGKLQGMAEHP